MLPIIAKQTGTHYVKYEYLRTVQTIEISTVEGEFFVLDDIFNESATAKITITNPDGSDYTLIDEEGNIYGCYSFDVRLTKELNKSSLQPLLDECNLFNNKPNIGFINKLFK